MANAMVFLPSISVVDLTFRAKRDTTVSEVNQILHTAAEGELKAI